MLQGVVRQGTIAGSTQVTFHYLLSNYFRASSNGILPRTTKVVYFALKTKTKYIIITWKVLLLTLSCTATIMIQVRDHLGTAIHVIKDIICIFISKTPKNLYYFCNYT